MSENKKTDGDGTREFKRGVEAGLNSEDTKSWQAGYELGRQYSDKETKKAVEEIVPRAAGTPLFLRSTLDSHMGDAQDEKDKSAE